VLNGLAMILINVTLTCHSGLEDRLRQLLLDTMAASRAEDGCVHYRFTAAIDEPDAYHLVEMWRDEAALRAHLQGKAFKHFLATLPSLGTLVESVAYNGELAPYQIPR
jgi:quinol monooxygenase YgiN